MKQVIILLVFFAAGLAVSRVVWQPRIEVVYVNVPIPYAHEETGAGSAQADVPTMIVVKERATAPTTPATAYGYIYALSSDGQLYYKDDTGTAVDLTVQ